ncbi:MAG: aromatic ring-hydroxylating oxygenase subunit alpha [Ilumatobacteraceae bacterium]|nr:aromatic ring-hydroxylating dioxygenase subunit alpha [Actinomycetota bacterium]MDA3011891.1 aromatic ring-hydroxylating dioxygenase subunit alpha [Actinomycetota bacterium]MDA3024547.1 aromatic ring-hydroxylating dioxygenase subunit alpha [Actinomycetota bacterium]
MGKPIESAQEVPGAARAPGPSLHEQLLADPTPPPWPLLVEAPAFLGDQDVPYSNYTSNEYFYAEFDHMWSKTWQWACHVDHLAEPGDYYVYDIGPHSAVIVRTESGEIKAYVNACMHRGTQLKPAGGCGFAQQLKCPFHGWTWSLDGRLVDLPDRWDFPHVSDQSHALPEVQVAEFAGFVWLNFDPEAQPLADYLGVIPSHFAEFGFEDRYVETHVRKKLPCNWKAAIEAFLEAYHVRETHSTGQLGDEVTTQYDIFPPNVSRFIHTRGLNSPQRPVPQTEEELFAGLTRGFPLDGSLPPGVRARDEFARLFKADMSKRYGRDMSHLSESIVVDSIEYFCFPNAFFFPGLSLPMIYRFRPDPDDVDISYFDLLILRPRPPEGDSPPPPEVIELDIDDSYTLAKGLGGLGRVYDQDTSNMKAQTLGFRASRKRGQTLGNYQEVRARHLQLRVAEFLRAGGFDTDG